MNRQEAIDLIEKAYAAADEIADAKIKEAKQAIFSVLTDLSSKLDELESREQEQVA